MKKALIFVAIFNLTTVTFLSFGQQPNLWLEGNVTTNTTLDDGFEDVSLPPFTSGGNASWSVQSVEAYAGTYAAQSGTISDTQSTYIRYITSVIEPSTLSFAVKVSSEEYFDFLSFEINGNELLSVSGEIDWQVYNYDLPLGTDTLTWTYSKDINTSSGSDASWLDSITIKYISGQVLQISDGLQAAGKLLISDSNGKASWASPDKIFDYNSLPLVLHKDMPFGAYGPEDYAPLIVENKLGAGIRIRQAAVGIRVDSTSGSGFLSFSAGADGFSSYGAVGDGFSSSNAGVDGFYSSNAGAYGFYSYNTGVDGFYSYGAVGDGFSSSNAGAYGFYSYNAGGNGFVSYNDGFDGFSSESAGDDGFYSLDAGDDGFQSSNAGADGFTSLDAVGDGFNSYDAGADGFYSSNAGDDGFHSAIAVKYGFISVNAGSDGFYSFGNTGDEGYFSGTVTVTGNVSKGGGSFKIDHPLDPENKFLYHSFVESPDMMNIYNGNVALDENGEATVTMPDWFDALNMEFRYQLTSIGAPGPNLYIAQKMEGNAFRVAGGQPGSEVSWQVTGIRQDRYANQNRIEVEVEKPVEFKGYYLHPEAYDMPFEKGFDFVKNDYKTLAEFQEKGKRDQSKEEVKKEEHRQKNKSK